MDCKSINTPNKTASSIFYLVEAFLGSTPTNVQTAPPKTTMFDDLHGLESLTVRLLNSLFM
jgi:hypothetical protein